MNFPDQPSEELHPAIRVKVAEGIWLAKVMLNISATHGGWVNLGLASGLRSGLLLARELT